MLFYLQKKKICGKLKEQGVFISKNALAMLQKAVIKSAYRR